jgi:DNA-directed RNA polymerase subunit RPC12/RpoP
MEATIFDSISHADFLRLTLAAFSRQGYSVEPSSAAGADGVLIGKNGARICILCKKYRGAFIGRPVLQQFYGAMIQLGCTQGYLVTTTDCSPEAYDFAAGKGIILYSSKRTVDLLRAAFGNAFIRTGKMPELGQAKTIPAGTRQAVSVASYERVAVSGLKKAAGPVKAPGPVHAPKPAQAPEPVKDPRSVQGPEPVQAPDQVEAPEPVRAPGPIQAPEPVQAPEPESALLKEAAKEELPEEVQEVETIEFSGTPEAVPSEHTTIIVCLECNKQLKVPIDQGVITVTCPECGMRRIYQPELNEAGELKTTTVITCQGCSQKLNVPTNRGQLNVRCPQCKAAWLFTP